MTEPHKLTKTAAQFFLRRFVVLGTLLVVVFGFIADQRSLHALYLDYLRDDGGYLQRFNNKEFSFDKRQFEKKILYYRALIDYLPFKALSYSNLGFCYFHLQEYEKALDAYQKAAALDPKQYTFYYDLGVIATKLQNYRLAASLFEQNIGRIRQMESYYSYLAKQFQSTGALPFAQTFFQLSRQAEKDQELSFVNLTLIYTGLKQYETAYRFARAGAIKRPQSSELHFYAGQAAFMLKNYATAVQHFNAAIKLNPKSPKSHYYRGLCMRKLNDIPEYKKDMQKALILRNAEGEREREKEYSLENASLHFYDDNWYFMNYGKTGGPEL